MSYFMMVQTVRAAVSDIRVFGRLQYECLTGRIAFQGETMTERSLQLSASWTGRFPRQIPILSPPNVLQLLTFI